MILVDTSVWVDHFRHADRHLAGLLHDGLVVVHAFVIGEIACGNLTRRSEVLTDLRALSPVRRADEEEVLALVDQHRLWGIGIGWIDAHLLASTLLAGCQLWTRDRRLHQAARKLGVAYPPATASTP